MHLSLTPSLRLQHKKRYALLLLLFISLAAVKAQRFEGGAIAGLSTGQIDGDNSSGYERVDFTLGGWVAFPLNNNFSLRAEMAYIGKGSRIVQNNVYEKRTVLRYIEFPFLIRYQFWQDFTAAAGPAPAFLFFSRMEENGAELPDTPYDNFNRFDIAGLVDIGYIFTENLQISMRWSYSMLPFRTDKTPYWYNNVLSYTLSYTF